MGQALLTMSNMLGHGSPIWRSLKILPRRDQKRILGIALLQTFMGFLDLAGVLVIGLLGALSVSGLQNTGPANRINDVCLLYTSPSPRDRTRYRMPSSA